MIDLAFAIALSAALWFLRPSNMPKIFVLVMSVVVIGGTIVRLIWWP